MRKVIALEFVTLDGVIQAGGGPEEDTSGDFAYGGWMVPYSDDVIGAVMNKQMNVPFELFLGRKTFEIWAPYWSQHADKWQGVKTATKYVASNTMTSHEWQPSVFLSGDIAEKVSKLKQQPGPDLHVYGSANVLQTLLKHDLVDEILAKDISDNIGQWETLVCRWRHSCGVQGERSPSLSKWHHYRKLRACRRGYNRKFLNIRAIVTPAKTTTKSYFLPRLSRKSKPSAFYSFSKKLLLTFDKVAFSLLF